jgi:hypothetical protein
MVLHIQYSGEDDDEENKHVLLARDIQQEIIIIIFRKRPCPLCVYAVCERDACLHK